VKILIVDDNAQMRTFIRSLLKDVAQEFVEFAGGEEAIATFPLERPDWTLMDVVMPGIDGFTATRQIKERFPAARILIMTQHVGLRDSAREARATGFVSKEELTQLESIIIGAEGMDDSLLR